MLIVATSSQQFIQTIGGTFGIAVMNTVLNQFWYNRLVVILADNNLSNLADTLFANGSFNSNVIASLTGDVKTYVLDAFVYGFQASMCKFVFAAEHR